jgi:VanZ family protein
MTPTHKPANGPSGQPANRHTLVFHWVPLIAACLALFIQSSFPASEKLSGLFSYDKLLHVAAYAVLAVLFFRAYRTLKFGHRIHRVAYLSVISSGLYGLSDEIHQYFVPARSADPYDLLADILGGIFGAWICLMVMKRRGIASEKIHGLTR